MNGHMGICLQFTLIKKNDSYIKTQIESLPSYLNRTNFNFYYEPVKTDSTMSVSLATPYINNSLEPKFHTII